MITETLDITINKVHKQNSEILKKLDENFPTVKISKKAKAEKKEFLELFLSKYLDVFNIREDLSYILEHKDYETLLLEKDKKEVALVKAFLESSYFAETSKNATIFFSQKEMMIIPLLFSSIKDIKYKLN